MPFLGPVVQARILLALAADRKHRDTAALTQLTEAIDLAEPENMIRPFLDARPAIAGLIAGTGTSSAGTTISPGSCTPPTRYRAAANTGWSASISPSGS